MCARGHYAAPHAHTQACQWNTRNGTHSHQSSSAAQENRTQPEVHSGEADQKRRDHNRVAGRAPREALLPPHPRRLRRGEKEEEDTKGWEGKCRDTSAGENSGEGERGRGSTRRVYYSASNPLLYLLLFSLSLISLHFRDSSYAFLRFTYPRR